MTAAGRSYQENIRKERKKKMTVTVNISGLEPITEALNRLAQAMGAGGVSIGMRTGTAPGSPAVQPAVAGMAGGPVPGGAAGVPAAGAPQTGIPVSQPTNAAPAQGLPGGPSPALLPGQVPTTALPHGYSQDQLAIAMTGLVDQGKQPQVMQILAQFGAASLMQVPKEQYPALATQLRMLGANL